MQMPAQIISFETEHYPTWKRGPTTLHVLRLADTTPEARLSEVIDFELTEEQLKKLPTRELAGQTCEVGIREMRRGETNRLRITSGEILSLNGKPF